MSPDVSVIITSFNKPGYLEEAIKSSVIQEPNVEIIIVDDASSDDSLFILRELQKKYAL